MEKFYNPVKIYQGKDSLQELKNTVNELAARNILLLTYHQDVMKHEVMNEVLDILDQYHVVTKVFTVSNPDINDLYQLYNDTKDESIDLVIAVGGGSVLDVAKSLCCLYADKDDSVNDIRHKIKNKQYKKPKCHWLGLPTTCGTGSEVTCWATIWDREQESKLSLESQQNYAYAVFVDPRLLTSMPKSLVVSSALDATAHATEAYWAKHTNMISKIYALSAIQMILPHLEAIMAGDQRLVHYDALSKGSMLAGMAFSNTKTTACHSISYPLTLNYNIPHGAAVSLLIEPVMKKNLMILDNQEQLLSAFGIKNVDELGSKIKNYLQQVGIETSLKKWNVKKEDLKVLVSHCFTAGRMENNPRDLDENDVYDILESIY